MRFTVRTSVAVLLAGAALTGCAGEAPQKQSRPEPKPDAVLEASATSPDDTRLTWRTRGGDVAWRVLEFATERSGPYTSLGFLRPGRTSFRHTDLMPGTTFYYRLRPVHGPASRPVHVDLDRREADKESGSVSSSAPANLRANLMRGNGIGFRWTDRASDEDGYLIEVRRDGKKHFSVVAVFGPGVESAKVITLPDERRAEFRARAFRYGSSSNVVHRTTGN
ncbi:fibronectin type III domain-containing protein [Streptomyces sp. NPDC050658]|uniref:fibronectin type III domain-containing protein n=1 Tax=unclassified Streptomyces TaxID=2593676 RepID=UPI00343405F4